MLYRPLTNSFSGELTMAVMHFGASWSQLPLYFLLFIHCDGAFATGPADEALFGGCKDLGEAIS